MNQRINITLPQQTVRLLDRLTEKGHRSRFINEAVCYYVESAGRAKLRKQLKEGAKRQRELDLEIAKEWFPLEEEAWPRSRR